MPLFGLGSCDTREDVFYNEKQNPNLNYTATNDVAVFSYVKQINLPYSIEVNISDMGNVDFHVVGGDNDFTVTSAGMNVNAGLLNFPTGDHLLTFDTDSLGEYYFAIKCFDKYGKVDSLGLTLNVFDNWPPTANFTLTQFAGGYPHEYTFDSNGADPDQIHGGGLLRYIYVIDGEGISDSLAVPHKTFNYVFPQAGNYNIKHWTLDNDSALSLPFIQSFTIN